MRRLVAVSRLRRHVRRMTRTRWRFIREGLFGVPLLWGHVVGRQIAAKRLRGEGLPVLSSVLSGVASDDLANVGRREKIANKRAEICPEFCISRLLEARLEPRALARFAPNVAALPEDGDEFVGGLTLEGGTVDGIYVDAARPIIRPEGSYTQVFRTEQNRD